MFTRKILLLFWEIDENSDKDKHKLTAKTDKTLNT